MSQVVENLNFRFDFLGFQNLKIEFFNILGSSSQDDKICDIDDCERGWHRLERGGGWGGGR